MLHGSLSKVHTEHDARQIQANEPQRFCRMSLGTEKADLWHFTVFVTATSALPEHGRPHFHLCNLGSLPSVSSPVATCLLNSLYGALPFGSQKMTYAFTKDVSNIAKKQSVPRFP